MPTQLSFRTTDEAANQFDALYKAALAENPELTKGQFFSDFMAQRNAAPADQPEPVDMSQYIPIETHTDRIRSLSKENNEFYSKIVEMLNLTGEPEFTDIYAEITNTQQRAMSALTENNKTVEVERPLDENELRFKVEKLQLDIMQETARRLSAKFGIAVTVADLMVDVTVRYIVERHTEWFFPFVIAPNEFESLTGHKYKQLLLWLKKKPEA